MSGFFARMGQRAVGQPPPLRLRTAHRFEPTRRADPATRLTSGQSAIGRFPGDKALGDRVAAAGLPGHGATDPLERLGLDVDTIVDAAVTHASPVARERTASAAPGVPALPERDAHTDRGTAVPPVHAPTDDRTAATLPSASQGRPAPSASHTATTGRAAAAVDAIGPQPGDGDGPRPADIAVHEERPSGPLAGAGLRSRDERLRTAPSPRVAPEPAVPERFPATRGPRPGPASEASALPTVEVPDVGDLVRRHVLPELIARGLTGPHETVDVVTDAEAARRGSSDGSRRLSAAGSRGQTSLTVSAARYSTTRPVAGDTAEGRRRPWTPGAPATTTSPTPGPAPVVAPAPSVHVHIDRVVVARSPSARPAPPATPAAAPRRQPDHAAYLARRRDAR